ncbi:hypothetical protein Syun_029968 [Stephania yunnanensis]|uniref:Uncharacterized protein n=1 Tax=Stephania yunnanensis TaxID=152371 RepID=A0AAP0E6L1_9MAGN
MQYLDMIDLHNPDRDLRQLGYVQGKPKDPFRPNNADKSKVATSYSIKYT